MPNHYVLFGIFAYTKTTPFSKTFIQTPKVAWTEPCNTATQLWLSTPRLDNKILLLEF